jgi:hypothetical protein
MKQMGCCVGCSAQQVDQKKTQEDEVEGLWSPIVMGIGVPKGGWLSQQLPNRAAVFEDLGDRGSPAATRRYGVPDIVTFDFQ